MKPKDAYEDGECPDCGETIPDDTPEGGFCPNCGHVFWSITPDDDSLIEGPGRDPWTPTTDTIYVVTFVGGDVRECTLKDDTFTHFLNPNFQVHKYDPSIRKFKPTTGPDS